MKFTFKKLHRVWMYIWLPIFILMVMPFMQAGHPPIIFFSPFAISAGVIGHLFILLMNFVYSYSNKNIEPTANATTQGSWPWQVILLLVILSFMMISAIKGAIALSMMSETVSFGLFANATVLLHYLLPPAGLAALITRKPWGYRIIQLICLMLIILLMIYFITVLTYRHIPSDLFVLPVVAIIIFAYLYSFSKSVKVKSFFRLNQELQ